MQKNYIGKKFYEEVFIRDINEENVFATNVCICNLSDDAC